MARIGSLNILSSGISAGVVQTLTGNSGGAISPTAGNISTVGTGNITIVGAGSTLTTQLTGLTTNAIQVGAGTDTLTQLGPTNRAVLTTSDMGVPTLTPLTDGELIIGSSTGSPTAATLTAGIGISITNTPGSITITATGASGGFSWNSASMSQNVTPQNGYVVSGGSHVILTITGAALFGDIIQIVGNNTLWTLTGATMNILTTQGTTLDAKTGYDTITLVCVAAPNTYVATATQGNIEVTS